MRYKVAEYINKSLGGIRLKGNTVQCLRKTEARGASGRAIEKVVLTIDRWANELSSEAKLVLTPKEQEQWKEWKNKHDAEYRRHQLSISLNAAPATINAAATALRDNAGDVPDPEVLWDAIDYLSAELVRAGYEKPKKPRGRPAKQTVDDEHDYDVVPFSQIWPHGNEAPLPNFAPVGSDFHREYQILLDSYEAFKREQSKKTDP